MITNEGVVPLKRNLHVVDGVIGPQADTPMDALWLIVRIQFQSNGAETNGEGN